MKNFIGIILLILIGCTTFSSSSGDISVEFRPASLSPVDGLQEMKVVGLIEKTYVSQEIIISEKDISSARIVDGSERPQIEIVLTDNGTWKLSKATEVTIGNPLGIVIDGKLIGAPIIKQAINTSRMSITGQFTEKEASDIVDRINAQ